MILLWVNKSYSLAGKSDCLVNECWCVSAGGTTCSYPDPETMICDPDECADREECPGYGYWCDNTTSNVSYFKSIDNIRLLNVLTHILKLAIT